MANSSSSSDMVVLSRRSQVTFEHRRATFTPPWPGRTDTRSCTLHVNVGGGQFISGADRIFQHKPAIYGPGGPYISGDYIFCDRPPGPCQERGHSHVPMDQDVQHYRVPGHWWSHIPSQPVCSNRYNIIPDSVLPSQSINNKTHIHPTCKSQQYHHICHIYNTKLRSTTKWQN